ncbi:MAG: Rad52/Rad22 family DNA repair protein [Armatimonadota bacterium]
MAGLTDEMVKRLCAPLPKEGLSMKPGSVTKDGSAALVLTYMDSRTAQARLDDVAPGDWEFDWEVVHEEEKKLTVKGIMTVAGKTRRDAGQASDEDEIYKSAVSDAFKRCAVMFGVGRYLYDMPKTYWPGQRGQSGRGFYFDEPWKLDAYMKNVADAVAQGKAIPKNPMQEVLDGNRKGATKPQTSPKHQSTVTNDPHVTTQQAATINDIWAKQFGGDVAAWKDFQRDTIGRLSKSEALTVSEFSKLYNAAQKLKRAA